MPTKDEVDAARERDRARSKMTDTQRVVAACEEMSHMMELIFVSTRCPDCRGKGRDASGAVCTTCDGGGDVFHAMHTRLSGLEARIANMDERLTKLDTELRDEVRKAAAAANGAGLDADDAPPEPPEAQAGAGG